jgi:hypothetical protein
MQQERATQSEKEPEKEERHITSEESLRSLYLAERSRRSMIQSQLSVPVSIISFSIFGFVSFSQYFNIARWHEPVTATMIVLIVASLASLFTAMVFLARLDRRFITDDFDRIEAVRNAGSEREWAPVMINREVIERHGCVKELETLDRALNDKPEQYHEEVVGVLRCLVADTKPPHRTAPAVSLSRTGRAAGPCQRGSPGRA